MPSIFRQAREIPRRKIGFVTCLFDKWGVILKLHSGTTRQVPLLSARDTASLMENM